MTSTGESLNVPFFKKKKGARPTTARKRSISPEPASNLGASSSKTQVVLPNKRATSNLLSAGSKRTAAQRDGFDESDAPEKDGPDVKWTAEGSHTNAALDILAGDEAEELLAKRRRKTAGGDGVEVLDDGQYRGQNAYRTHIKKTTETPKAMRVGPQRGTNTIRTVTVVDYQPDVCKDYKETGFCGFGDTCKFLHDRGTYLAGWQLDKLAANPKKQDGDDSDSDSSDDEDVPFACLICRKPYAEPIVTRCGHYFCSACAIKRFAKTPKCLACGAPTGGMFNRADKIINKFNKKRQDKEDKKARDNDSDSNDIQIEGLVEKRDPSDDEDDSDDDSE